MTLKEYLSYLKEDWDFHKRNPELFVVWAVYLYALYLAFTEP